MTRLMLFAVLANAQGTLRPESQASQPIVGYTQPVSPVVMVPQMFTNSQGMQYVAMVPMQPQFGQPIGGGVQQPGILQGSEIPQRPIGVSQAMPSGQILPPMGTLPQSGQILGNQATLPPMAQSGQILGNQATLPFAGIPQSGQILTSPMGTPQSGQILGNQATLPPLVPQEGQGTIQSGHLQSGTRLGIQEGTQDTLQPQDSDQTVQLPVDVPVYQIDSVAKAAEQNDQEKAHGRKGKGKRTQKVPLVPVIPVVETNASLSELPVINATVVNVTLPPTDQEIVTNRQALHEQEPIRRNLARQLAQGDARCEGDSVREWAETFFQTVRSWSYDKREKGCGILNRYFDENTTLSSWMPVLAEVNEICGLLKHAWTPSNFAWKITFVNELQGKVFGDLYISGKLSDSKPIPEGLNFQFVLQFDQDTCKVLRMDILPLESQAMFEMYMTPPLRHLHDLMRVLLKEGTGSQKLKNMFSPNAFVEVPNLYHSFVDRNYRVRIDDLENSEVFKAFDFDNSTLQEMTFPFASQDKAVAHIMWDTLITKNGTELKNMEFWMIFDFECKSKVAKPAVMFDQLRFRPPRQSIPSRSGGIMNSFSSSTLPLALQSCDSTLGSQFCQDGTPCDPKYLSCEDPKQCKCPRYFPDGTHFCDTTRNDSKCEDGTPCKMDALNCSDPKRCECPLNDQCNVTGVTLLVNRPLMLLAASPKFKFSHSDRGGAEGEKQSQNAVRKQTEQKNEAGTEDTEDKKIATKDAEDKNEHADEKNANQIGAEDATESTATEGPDVQQSKQVDEQSDNEKAKLGKDAEEKTSNQNEAAGDKMKGENEQRDNAPVTRTKQIQDKLFEAGPEA